MLVVSLLEYWNHAAFRKHYFERTLDIKLNNITECHCFNFENI